MAIRTYRPTTASRRNMSNVTFDDITKAIPERRLTESLPKTGGRNNRGVITTRHIGGGHKRRYRIIDFRRDKDGQPATVKAIEYDPNRNARILLAVYKDGEKRYVLAPKGVAVGDRIESGEKVDIKPGNCLPLRNIPEGTFVHNVELTPGKGGQLCRAAGTGAQILGHEERHTVLRLASGETRKILSSCRATVGTVGNEDFALIKKGKAGKTRWLGTRPTVRGSAMNPVDHPHGGGEGKSPIGRDAPRTPWGKRALGVKTRKAGKASSRLIVRRRKGK